MKVALLHTPYYHQAHMENIKFASDNFGVLPPLSLMYLSSLLKENGHEAEIIDIKAEGLDKRQVIDRLERFEAEIVGVMLMPHTVNIALRWAGYIKSELDVTTIGGNYALNFYPKAIVSRESIDYGIIGSAKKALPQLLRALEADKSDLKSIPGVVYSQEGKIRVNSPASRIEDLNQLPWPDRESIDNSLYGSLVSKKSPFTILVTSYGCKYNCNFCDMGNFGYSEREPQDVVDEIESCIKDHNIKEIDFFDRDFLINKERSKKICREIIKRNLDFDWSCRTRVDNVDKQTLALMKKAGCRLILYGIESGNQLILDRDKKGTTIEQTERAIRLTKSLNIETLGFFILGHSQEKEEGIKRTIALAKKLPLDYAQFFRMIGKPGAQLYEQTKEELGYDYFEKLIRGEERVKELPRPWTDLSNEEIDLWIYKAYRNFYLRPLYILRQLMQVKDLSDLERKVGVGVKLLKSLLHGHK